MGTRRIPRDKGTTSLGRDETSLGRKKRHFQISPSKASLGPPRWAAGLGGIVAVGWWLLSGPSLPSDDRRAVELVAGQVVMLGGHAT
jgi:hypothetical protein